MSGGAASIEDRPSAAPTPEEIAPQLERILTSLDFSSSDRVRRFLRYVVTEALAGRADYIKAYSIAVGAFGRPSSFDPQADPVVRIEAGRVRRSLERYYLTAGQSDPILIAIPKGSYVPTFTARLADAPRDPPTVTLEAAPEPVSSPPTHRASKARLAVLGLLAAILGIGLWETFEWFVLPQVTGVGSSPAKATGPEIPRLLVEPFVDLTRTGDSATIATGLTEEVIGQLTKFKELIIVQADPRPVARTAAPDATPPTPRYALAGSLRAENGAIRLAARVVNRQDGSVIWAGSYDRDLKVKQLLDVEADVAREVAIALGQPYGVILQADAAHIPQRPPEDWEAYACTLSYYSYRTALDQPAHAAVKQCLERAVERFPGYATAWALLSLAYSDELRFRYRINPSGPPPLKQAIEAARRAVALDPTNVRGLEAQMLGLFFSNDIPAALKVGEQAIALNPNDIELIGEVGIRLAQSGDWGRGCPYINAALERNPGPLGYYETVLSLCFYMQSDYQQALWIGKADLEANPLYHFIAAAIYGQLGQTEAAQHERDWILANAPSLLKDVHRELAMRIKAPDDQAHFLEGLRKAGLELPVS